MKQHTKLKMDHDTNNGGNGGNQTPPRTPPPVVRTQEEVFKRNEENKYRKYRECKGQVEHTNNRT
jgi:hypothetical protein